MQSFFTSGNALNSGLQRAGKKGSCITPLCLVSLSGAVWHHSRKDVWLHDETEHACVYLLGNACLQNPLLVLVTHPFLALSVKRHNCVSV